VREALSAIDDRHPAAALEGCKGQHALERVGLIDAQIGSGPPTILETHREEIGVSSHRGSPTGVAVVTRWRAPRAQERLGQGQGQRALADLRWPND
jgi:hypothetical protein